MDIDGLSGYNIHEDGEVNYDDILFSNKRNDTIIPELADLGKPTERKDGLLAWEEDMFGPSPSMVMATRP